MRFQKQIINVFAILFLINLVHAKEEVEPKEIVLTPGPLTGKYNKDDLDEAYDESTEIQCTGTKCISSSDNVLLDEGKITISKAGTYVLGGKLNGQLNIAATKEDLIHLILRNATISSDFGPAVYGEKCKKLIITTEGQNTISDSINYPEDAINAENNEEQEKLEDNEAETKKKSPNACIFIKNNLTFNGKGSLDVNANFNEGIRSKKILKFVSGKINVFSKGNAIKAKESISIKEAEINVETGKSAIKVTKNTDPEEGFVVIDGGKITIKAVKDGIHAETHLTVNDGIINIIESDEGLEGQMIDILGGKIFIECSNDCINAAKINAESEADNTNFLSKDHSKDEQVYVKMTGGKVDVRSKYIKGLIDGIDSNGSIYIGDNAEVFVDIGYGGAFGHTASLDAEGAINIDVGSTVLITAPGKIKIMFGPDTKNTNNAKTVEKTENVDDSEKIEKTENVDDPETTEEIENVDDPETTEEIENVDDSVSIEDTEDSDDPEIREMTESTDNSETIEKHEKRNNLETSEKTVKASNSKESKLTYKSLMEQLTFKNISLLYPMFTEDQVFQFIEYAKSIVTEDVDGGFIYDEPNSKFCSQPYVRVLVEHQKEGTPIVIKNSEGKVIYERAPREEFGIIFFTSPEIVEGETYTVNVGSDLTKSVIAKVDTEKTKYN